jgi:hypothetical protein
MAYSTVDDDVLAELLDSLSQSIKKEQYRTAVGVCQTILNTLPSTKSKSVAFKALLSGLISGLSDGSITKAFAKQQAAKYLGQYQVVVMDAMSALLKDEEEKADSEEVVNVTPVLHPSDSSVAQMKMKLSKDNYFIGYSDILVITQPSLDVQKLNANGFGSRLISQYVILERQLIVGVNNLYLREQAEKRTGKLKKNENHHSEIYSDFIATVKAKFPSRRYVEPSPSSIQWNDASWSWLMTADQFQLLRSCQRGGGIGLKVASWAFPFEKA